MQRDTFMQAAQDSDVVRSDNAPRGAKAVLTRILKDGANVPLFFAQTLVASLRDQGYDNTTSALCEHVDNSIESGATEVRVFFRQTGGKGAYSIDTAVYDNGRGMSPNTLKVAMSFGGSLNYNNRAGIGRFGMGMKTAALSISKVLDVYSWQEPGAFYNATLDIDAIGRERSNSVEIADPQLVTELPSDVADLFRKPQVFPKNVADQELLTGPHDEVEDLLGSSGTLVYMANCDRLSYAKAQTLAEHATKEMARIYRRFIADGIAIYVNNRRLTAFDPTYAMSTARHVQFLDDVDVRTSRLIRAMEVDVPVSHSADTSKAKVTVRLYKLPIETWSHLPKKTLKNDLQVFNGLTVSILRNGRELWADRMPELTTRHSITHWFRVQIDFSGVLDEAFGVATNKQGVRLKEYVKDAIKAAIGEDISFVINEIRRFQSEQRAAEQGSKPSTSEKQATETDPHQAKSLALTPEEEAQVEENLQVLAMSLRRDGETDEEAFERIKASQYIIHFGHDDYWPFYRAERRFGRVILTINTAHPFFTDLYEPLRRGNVVNETGDDDEGPLIDGTQEASAPLVALELLLLSLARTQATMSSNDAEIGRTLDLFQREWSQAYRVQLTA
jgi:hypothetical protein